MHRLIWTAMFIGAWVGTTSCGSSRIGGTYVAHGDGFASMLQLTQSERGQITGVIDGIGLRGDGKLHSDHAAVIGGAMDGDQLTLTVQSFLFGNNIGGTVGWRGIKLHIVGGDGQVYSLDFRRGSAADFTDYSTQLKEKADGASLSATLQRRAQQFRGTVQAAEQWITNAQVHVHRISDVKAYYQKLEDRMRSLVAQERTIGNDVARSQISVTVIQGNTAGIQEDIQVQQTWDLNVLATGRNIKDQFAGFPKDCSIRKELKKRGATSAAIEVWENACKQAQAEKLRFDAAFKTILDTRAELKRFQVAAESHRRALVDEASRIQ